jgi:hypothetical protein
VHTVYHFPGLQAAIPLMQLCEVTRRLANCHLALTACPPDELPNGPNDQIDQIDLVDQTTKRGYTDTCSTLHATAPVKVSSEDKSLSRRRFITITAVEMHS